MTAPARPITLRTLVAILAGAVLLAAGRPPPPAPRVPAYTADRRPPRAPCYQDGQTGRYLLGGTWLYRADPTDVGLAQGWWRNVAATDGWSPVTVPNAYNAGDFSAGEHERLGRLVPPRLHAPRHGVRALRAARPTATGSSASSRSTTAPPCGSTAARSARHAGAYLPFEFDLSDAAPRASTA